MLEKYALLSFELGQRTRERSSMHTSVNPDTAQLSFQLTIWIGMFTAGGERERVRESEHASKHHEAHRRANAPLVTTEVAHYVFGLISDRRNMKVLDVCRKKKGRGHEVLLPPAQAVVRNSIAVHLCALSIHFIKWASTCTYIDI